MTAKTKSLQYKNKNPPINNKTGGYVNKRVACVFNSTSSSCITSSVKVPKMRVVVYHFITHLALYLAAAANECSNGDIRMTNGIVSMTSQAYYIAGGLQVCVNNKWATVCQRSWDEPDATVACRQLGLSYKSEWVAYIDFRHETISWVDRDCGLVCLTDLNNTILMLWLASISNIIL